MEGKFQRGFEANHACVQVFNMGLLLGDRGVELVHFVVQFDGVGKSIPYALGEPHRYPFLEVLASACMRASDSATKARVLSIERMVFFVSRMTRLAM